MAKQEYKGNEDIYDLSVALMKDRGGSLREPVTRKLIKKYKCFSE